MPTYLKPALSVAQQVDLLESRGLAIPNKAEAEHYLAHISYYRLRAYWLVYEDLTQTSKHQFLPNTSFDDILSLYVFDRELRLLVLDAIERAEVSFRTAFTHVLALESGSHAHLKGNLFAGDYYSYLTSLTEEISRSSETFIAHYKATYSDPALPPIWACSEVMTLGLISRFYKSIAAQATRQKVADIWQLDEKVTSSLVHHFAYIRNTCAHHARLWNRRFTVIAKMPRSPRELASRMNPASERNLYNTLVSLAWVLDIVSPSHSWTTRIAEHLQKLPSKVSASQMGFPADWRTRAPWTT